jgi:hypothetical protein
MNEFLWASGHLGWGIFALLVFTGLWALLTDLVWRLQRMRLARLLAMMGLGWIAGIAMLVLAFCIRTG